MDRLEHQKDAKQNIRTPPQWKDVLHHATAAPVANKKQILIPKGKQILHSVGPDHWQADRCVSCRTGKKKEIFLHQTTFVERYGKETQHIWNNLKSLH